jgi:hypothetical protein
MHQTRNANHSHMNDVGTHKESDSQTTLPKARQSQDKA